MVLSNNLLNESDIDTILNQSLKKSVLTKIHIQSTKDYLRSQMSHSDDSIRKIRKISYKIDLVALLEKNHIQIFKKPI